MIPALSQVCSLASPFGEDLADYAAGACSTIELWLGKLDGFLENHSVGEANDLLVRHGLAAPVAAGQGGLLASQGQARREHWAHFQRRLAACQALNVQTMVLACDVAAPITAQDVDRVRVSLRQAGDLAATHGIRLALEPQARSALGNNLQTVVALVEECGHPAVGACLDAFAFFVGPSKTEDLGLVTVENLYHVQLCDLLARPRELATDADRILPGDGDQNLNPIIDRLRSIDYRGVVSVEVLNPVLWQVPARQFGEVALTALRRVLGLAET
jgi:sugar phosphate isomerase/epimerase